MNWIHMAQDTGNTMMNFRFPYSSGNFLTSLETVSFPKRTALHGVTLPGTVATQPRTFRAALLMHTTQTMRAQCNVVARSRNVYTPRLS
jgi:hypothetical protein